MPILKFIVKTDCQPEMYSMIKGKYTIRLWQLLLKQVCDFQLNRKSNSNIKDIRGLNISIIILLTTCIESFLYEILSQIVLIEKEQAKSDFDYRIFSDLKNKLDKASWTDLADLTLLITGKKLTEYCKNSDWEKILILYKLRNKLVHGKNIQIYKDGQNEEYIGVYTNLITVMRKLKLIELNGNDIFSYSVNNNLILATKAFIKTIFESFSAKFDSYNEDGFLNDICDEGIFFIENLK